jgi:hypothetical protein
MPTATVRWSSAAAPVVLGDATQETIRFFGSITFSAATDTYATGGLLALTGFDRKNLGPFGDRTPLACYLESQSGSGLSYALNFASGKLQIFGGGGSGTAGLTEITNGTALNAVTPSVFADVVSFELVVPRR